MPYCYEDDNGGITSQTTKSSHPSQVFYADDSPEFLAYMGKDLDGAKKEKKDEMSLACKAECEQGIVSSVLGTEHYYGTRTFPHHDQFNLGVMFDKARLHDDDPAWPGVELTCSEDGGAAFVRKMHTAAQIIAVAEQAQEMISNANNKLLNDRYPKIFAAVDQAALALIVWL